MLALLGSLSVLIGTAASAWLCWKAAGAARSKGGIADLGRPAATVLGAGVAAMAVLQAALIGNDFSLAYVANHHARATPFPFNVATAWAALEGSIVLWALVLSVFTWTVARRHAASPDRLGAAALAVMAGVALFFFSLQATVANPFEVCIEPGPASCLASSALPWAAAQAPADGLGPNPLLQNHILMAIHPPMLYLGFVGLTVPFAHAIGALAIGRPGAEWLRRSKRSTVVAWTFLSAGITLGGWWAYEVLSWGGYWAWDPVENASLMPWLAATAFLHSSLVQERRGMLQAWNFVLVIAAFALTILGTFLTRSGTIASVHSFTQSAIGPVLLGFLVVVIGGSFALLATRADQVASAPRLESLSSREGTFLANNLLLSVYGVVVLVGTLYPILVEAFAGTPVAVGRPFFDRLAVPLSFGLLLFMGIGPVAPWRVARPGLLWERTRIPLQVALVAGAVTVLATSRLGYVVGAVVAGTFVIAVIVAHLLRSARRIAGVHETNPWRRVGKVLAGDQTFWAGQLSHVGVALVAVGIAFAANLADHSQVALQPGETANFAGYRLTYRSGFQQREPNRLVAGARVMVERGGALVTELSPSLNDYEERGVIASPAVHTGAGGDLYLTLLSIDAAGATIRMDTSPLQWLVWAGGLTVACGGIWSVLARRRPTSHIPARELLHV